MKPVVLGLLVAGLSSTAIQAIAQTASSPPPSIAVPQTAVQTMQPQPRPPANTLDPNQVICEHAVEETGSRITPHMLCGTRAEWAQRRQEDRDKTEQVQRGSLETVH